MQERVEKAIAAVNEDILTYDGDNLFGDGIIDSLQAVNIVVALEDEFDIEIDANYVVEENFMTKDTILEFVKEIIE